MELILTDIELGLEGINEETNSFDVWWNKREKRFVAINPITNEIHRYKLTKSIEEIIYEFSDKILEYRYADMHDDNHEITIDDIFMFGKYVELIQ